MSARTAAPTVRAVDLSPSIVLKQVSIFENCSSIPRMPPISCCHATQVDLIAGSVGDCSPRRHAGQVERIDARGETVSAMYAPDCHNLLL
jgi:hypothetical protein